MDFRNLSTQILGEYLEWPKIASFQILSNYSIIPPSRIGYGLYKREIRVRFRVAAKYFSFLHNVQTDSGAHRTTYKLGTGGCFPGGNVAGT
jgi:hypothetical protein